MQPDDGLSADEFFDRLHANLKEGVVRLIFCLEEAPVELASIVNFLNRQMERTEVLLVELRQYREGQTRLVMPRLLGYTEEARRVKAAVSLPQPAVARQRWNAETFFAEAAKRLAATDVERLRSIYAYAIASPYGLNWGAGKQLGSFGLKYQPVCKRALLTFWTNGELTLNFGWLAGSLDVEALRDDFKQEVIDPLGLDLSPNWAVEFPNLKLEQWRDKAEVLLAGLTRLAQKWATR